MSSKLNQVLSVSFDASSVKVAEVKSSGLIVKVAKEDVLDADVVSAVKKALKKFNTKKTNVICVLPSDVATTKNIEVPAVDAQEIDSIINLQAGRYTPFSKEEIVIGYNHIGSYQANHTKVLLVIVKRNIIKEKIDILSAAGVDVEQVSFAPEGIAKFYAKSKVKKDRSPLGIIDVNYDRTTLIIESRSNVVLSRSIPVGIKHFRADAAEAQTKMIDEIKATITSYKDEKIDVEPNRYILTSDFNMVASLETPLNEALEGVVDVAPFINHVKASKSVLAQVQNLFSDNSLLEVVAAGMNCARAEIDLLPEEVQMRRNMVAKSREAMTAGMLALITLVLVGAGFISKVYYKNSFYEDNLIERYAEDRNKVAMLEAQIKQNQVVKKFLDKRFMSLNTWDQLHTIIPKEVYITGVNIDETGNVTLVGVSQSMSRVFSLVTDLEDAELFRNVKTKSTATRKQDGKDVASFEIGFKLEGIAPHAVAEDMEVESGEEI